MARHRTLGKGNARPQIGKFRQQCEYVIFACKGSFMPATRQCLPGLYKHAVIPRKKSILPANRWPSCMICSPSYLKAAPYLLPSWVVAPQGTLALQRAGALWAWSYQLNITPWQRPALPPQCRHLSRADCPSNYTRFAQVGAIPPFLFIGGFSCISSRIESRMTGLVAP